MIAFVVKYWQASLIVALLAFGWLQWAGHNRALVERGKALERARVADSTLAVLRPQLARSDTIVQTRTNTVIRTIARVDSLRDTVLLHLTDTVVVRQFVERADSALAACSDLAGSCTLFRTQASATIAALEVKVRAVPLAVGRSCVSTGTVSGLVGVGLGLLGARITHR